MRWVGLRRRLRRAVTGQKGESGTLLVLAELRQAIESTALGSTERTCLNHVSQSLDRLASLQRMAGQPTSSRRVRVFFAGNSGRGKSFLCNILMQRAQFASFAAANRVTAAAQSECLDPAPPLVHTTAALTSIVDAPGMLEAGDRNLEANQAEIVKALRMPGDLLLVYVIDSNALRPLHEDLQTARTLRQFLLDHGMLSSVLERCEMAVYNNYDCEDVEDTPAFVSEVVHLIRAGIGAPQLRVGVVPKLKRAKAEQYQPGATLGGRVMLRTLLNGGVPAKIDAAKIKTNAELRTDSQQLERQKAEELRKHAISLKLQEFARQLISYLSAWMLLQDRLSAVVSQMSRLNNLHPKQRAAAGNTATQVVMEAIKALSSQLGAVLPATETASKLRLAYLVTQSEIAKLAYRSYHAAIRSCVIFGGGSHAIRALNAQGRHAMRARNAQGQQHLATYLGILAEMDRIDKDNVAEHTEH